MNSHTWLLLHIQAKVKIRLDLRRTGLEKWKEDNSLQGTCIDLVQEFHDCIIDFSIAIPNVQRLVVAA